MKTGNDDPIDDLVKRYPQMEPVKEKISEAAEINIDCLRKGGLFMVCGNGGSSSDSEHIVGELMKGFSHERPLDETVRKELILQGGDRGKYLSLKLQQGLPSISLSAHTGLITAVANDTDASLIYAQQVVSYGKPGDVLLAISTSGNSQNIIDAVITARAKGVTAIGLTGKEGGKMAEYGNINIKVPADEPAKIQELHLPVYHAICMKTESVLFDTETKE